MNALALVVLLAAQESGPDLRPFLAEMRAMRQQVALLEIALRDRAAALDAMAGQVRAVQSDVADIKGRPEPPASPFMGGPPPSSDTVGVAKTVVFAPRVEADNTRRRDLVKIRVRRLEAGGSRAVGEVELGSDGFVELPIDQNGGLYVADWSTTDGQTFTLTLRDGATGQEAASAKVQTLQSQGHFLFVGYRLE
ncbi:MAG: hypothetical protein ABW221_06365 [Vicinamibacteria bacterium]